VTRRLGRRASERHAVGCCEELGTAGIPSDVVHFRSEIETKLFVGRIAKSTDVLGMLRGEAVMKLVAVYDQPFVFGCEQRTLGDHARTLANLSLVKNAASEVEVKRFRKSSGERRRE